MEDQIGASFKKGELMNIKGILFQVDKFDPETLILKIQKEPNQKPSIGL